MKGQLRLKNILIELTGLEVGVVTADVVAVVVLIDCEMEQKYLIRNVRRNSKVGNLRKDSYPWTLSNFDDQIITVVVASIPAPAGR